MANLKEIRGIRPILKEKRKPTGYKKMKKVAKKKAKLAE